MNRMSFRWRLGMLLALVGAWIGLGGAPVHAHDAMPPGAQVLGPAWQGHRIAVTGTVIAFNGPCRQLAVDRDGWPGAGGRLWVCRPAGRALPGLGQAMHVRGRVTGTRLTRMGPWWRVVPVVELP